jgi:hypothetical protein
MSVNFPDMVGEKGIDNLPLIVYPSMSMSNVLAQPVKCKHCEKTFPTAEAHKAHLKKVEAGKMGGYRKQKAPRARYMLPVEQNPPIKQNGTPTALDRLADIRARKEHLFNAMAQTVEEEKAAMADVQREYDEQMKRVAALSTEITVQRRAAIAVREELEAHKPQTPES